MKIDNLKPGSSYKFDVYAKNERGQGEAAWSLVVDTKAASMYYYASSVELVRYTSFALYYIIKSQ